MILWTNRKNHDIINVQLNRVNPSLNHAFGRGMAQKSHDDTEPRVQHSS